MSKAKARTAPTAATIRIKDAKVLKSSHGKFPTIVALEKQRLETTAANLARRKGKKKED